MHGLKLLQPTNIFCMGPLPRVNVETHVKQGKILPTYFFIVSFVVMSDNIFESSGKLVVCRENILCICSLEILISDSYKMFHVPGIFFRLSLSNCYAGCLRHK